MLYSYNPIPEPATDSMRQITLHRDYHGGIGGKWRKGELFGNVSSKGLITS